MRSITNEPNFTRMRCFRPISAFYLFALFLPVFLFSCSAGYNKSIETAENLFHEGKYDKAIDGIRYLAKDSAQRDRLLYFMEAGTILRVQGDYERSNAAFKDAENIADTLRKSLSAQALSFALNDRKSRYRGEDFEVVMIRMYIALNYLMLNNLEAAKVYFRKVDYDLKMMKYEEPAFKQNLLVRYLDAIVSESQGDYNAARVQYKNITNFAPDFPGLGAQQYVLAVKENDSADQKKYAGFAASVPAYGTDLKKKPYHSGMGELIVVYESGDAAIKASRGRLFDDPIFVAALRTAIHTAILTENKKGLTVASVMAMLGTAEHPIPKYVTRSKGSKNPVNIILNNHSTASTFQANSFSDTAIHHFQDNYNKIVAKNVSSIAVKIVLAASAVNALANAAEDNKNNGQSTADLIRFVGGLSAGAAVAATTKPDLRCWHTAASDYQVQRIFLEPGTYRFSVPNSQGHILGTLPETVTIQKGKPAVINFRSR